MQTKAGQIPLGAARAKRPLRYRTIFRAAFVIVAAFVMYHLTTTALVARWDASAPRDPETGILIGAEARDLGPEDATVAVLLVHGFIGAGSNFGELPERLAAAGFRVRVMRLPGHGTSPRDFAKTPVDEFQRSVLGEVHALRERHEKLILVGHSMGGTLITLTAAEPGIDVDGLVLAAPYFGVTHRWYYGLTPERWAKLTSPVVRWAYKSKNFVRVKRREAVPDIVSYRWLPSQGSLTLIELGDRANEPGTLDAVTCPVLLLHAQDDNAAAIGAARTAFESMASDDKTFVTLENSDHHLFWDYDRERVIGDTLRFVEGIAAK